jgi:hypothetical protein
MNNISGWFSYDGIIVQQHNDVGVIFNSLFTKLKPSRILEIGTASGGLTLVLRNILDELNLNNTQLRSYDVDEKHQLSSHIQNGCNIQVLIKNVFNYNYDQLIEPNEIESYIKQDGLTLILCDGGSKKNEFRLLSPFLKKGDIIMAHDYAPNENYFNENIKGKIWNWLEIQDSDINETCEEYNLKPFMEDDFRSIVWVCKIKE